MTTHLPPQDSSAKFFYGKRYPTASIIFFAIAGLVFLYWMIEIAINVLQGGTFNTYSSGKNLGHIVQIGISLLLAHSFQNPGVTLQTNSLGLIASRTNKKFNQERTLSLSWEDIKKVQKVSFNTTLIIKRKQGRPVKLGYFPGHMKEISKIIATHKK